MAKLKGAIAWLMALLAGGAAAWFIRGRSARAEARAQHIENKTKKTVDKAERRISVLKRDLVKNASKIARLEAKVVKKKERASRQLEVLGVPGEEVAARFRRLRL